MARRRWTNGLNESRTKIRLPRSGPHFLLPALPFPQSLGLWRDLFFGFVVSFLAGVATSFLSRSLNASSSSSQPMALAISTNFSVCGVVSCLALTNCQPPCVTPAARLRDANESAIVRSGAPVAKSVDAAVFKTEVLCRANAGSSPAGRTDPCFMKGNIG